MNPIEQELREIEAHLKEFNEVAISTKELQSLIDFIRHQAEIILRKDQALKSISINTEYATERYISSTGLAIKARESLEEIK